MMSSEIAILLMRITRVVASLLIFIIAWKLYNYFKGVTFFKNLIEAIGGDEEEPGNTSYEELMAHINRGTTMVLAVNIQKILILMAIVWATYF